MDGWMVVLANVRLGLMELVSQVSELMKQWTQVLMPKSHFRVIDFIFMIAKTNNI